MKIITICGLIGSGKDTAADIIINTLGKDKAIKLSFAGILKDVVASIFNWDRKLLEGDTVYSRQWREQVDEWWSKRLNIPNLTPRIILQHLGTNVLRNCFHQDIWLASLENRIMKLNYETVVITDCRFPNEIECLTNMGAKIIWIRRGMLPEWVFEYMAKSIIPEGIHPSEYSWLKAKFDYNITNSGSLEKLREKIENIVNSI